MVTQRTANPPSPVRFRARPPPPFMPVVLIRLLPPNPPTFFNHQKKLRAQTNALMDHGYREEVAVAGTARCWSRHATRSGPATSLVNLWVQPSRRWRPVGRGHGRSSYRRGPAWGHG